MRKGYNWCLPSRDSNKRVKHYEEGLPSELMRSGKKRIVNFRSLFQTNPYNHHMKKTYRSEPLMQLNEVGYPILSDELHQKVFGSLTRPVADPQRLERSQGLLSRFGIPLPVDFPENLYDGDLPFPKLIGEDINEHFEAMAAEFVDVFIEQGDNLTEARLPEIPGLDEIVFNPGWTKYTYNEKRKIWNTERVAYPDEQALIFDTETFVTNGAFPVIGSAIGAEAAYVWLAAEMVDPLLPDEEWTQYGLIPLPEEPTDHWSQHLV